MSNRKTGITAWNSLSWSPACTGECGGGGVEEGWGGVGAVRRRGDSSGCSGAEGCAARPANGRLRPRPRRAALQAADPPPPAPARTRGVVLHQLAEPQEEPLAEGDAGRVERAGGALHDAADLVLGVEVGAHDGLRGGGAGSGRRLGTERAGERAASGSEASQARWHARRCRRRRTCTSAASAPNSRLPSGAAGVASRARALAAPLAPGSSPGAGCSARSDSRCAYDLSSSWIARVAASSTYGQVRGQAGRQARGRRAWVGSVS